MGTKKTSQETGQNQLKSSAHNGKIDLARSVIEKYIELGIKHGRGYSKRFLASVLYEENPDMFTDEEDARLFIRMATGSAGVARRGKTNKDKIDLARRFALIENPYVELPNPEPFIIPQQYKKTLLIADLHSKFYDRRATMMAIDYGIAHGCDSVIINGDFMDFYGQSRFNKNALTLEAFYEEQEWGIEMLKLLQDCFCKVFLKKGNHDIRREQLHGNMAMRNNDILGLCNYSDYLFFDGSTVDIIEDYRSIIYGKANIIHGHELEGAFGGIHVAYNRLNKAMGNLISAHSHITQGVSRTDINDNLFASWVMGCLCNLHPRYSPKNRWNHGFGRIERDASGEFEMINKRIHCNKILPG